MQASKASRERLRRLASERGQALAEAHSLKQTLAARDGLDAERAAAQEAALAESDGRAAEHTRQLAAAVVAMEEAVQQLAEKEAEAEVIPRTSCRERFQA